MGKTYLFYDTETTGLNPCFDQIIQFAAIRTDEQLNELEHYQFFIRLNPDVIPSPQAFLTHGISLSDLQKQPSEYEAIQKIHALLNTPNTWSIGYNNLGFDDEFLRFSFYRNLLTPYTHQWANGCGRLDLYPIVLLYYLYKNDVLEWPVIDESPSLKLENLNACNHWVKGQAHDAMVDVRVTLALARQLKQHKNIWNYALGYFNKSVDLQRFNQLPTAYENTTNSHKEALLLQGQIGSQLNYQAPVLSLGAHHHYKNQTLWLRLDTDELSNTTADTIEQSTFVFRKRFAEPPLLLAPLKRFCAYLQKDRLEKAHANKAWLKDHADLFQLISDYHQHYKYPEAPNCDIDASLYQKPFLTPEEQHQCNRFHVAAVHEKPSIISEMTSERLKKQAYRLLARNYSNDLSNIDATEFSNYLKAICSQTSDLPTDYKGEKHKSVIETIDSIKTIISMQTLNEKQHKILDELVQYLYQLITNEKN
jgi:exodeoxyribonuclease-1